MAEFKLSKEQAQAIIMLIDDEEFLRKHIRAREIAKMGGSGLVKFTAEEGVAFAAALAQIAGIQD